MKSPIKHSLDHSLCLSHLKTILPERSVLWTFLLFSGQLEFSLAESKRFVCSHTDKKPIYEFWNGLAENPEVIHEIVTSKQFDSLKNKQLFYVLQENWPYYKNDNIRVALFFLLNRCSSDGNISSGEFNKDGVSPMALSYLKKFKVENFHLRYIKDFNALKFDMPMVEVDFLLFPMRKYSHNFFEYSQILGPEESAVNHANFFKKISKVAKKWVILYKNHPAVFETYGDFNIKMINKYGALIKDKSTCEEIIVTNF